MDLKESWPYVIGGGLVLLLLILSKSGASAGGSTLVAIPTADTGAHDALEAARDENRTSLLGAVVNSATALQGAVNGYRGQVAVTDATYQGEAKLSQINADAQTAIAKVNSATAMRISYNETQSANVQSSMNNKTARTVGVVGAVAGAVSSVVKALNPLSWF